RVWVRERRARSRTIAVVRVRAFGRDASEYETIARQPGVHAHFDAVVDTGVQIGRTEHVVGERDVAHLVVASDHLAAAVGQTGVEQSCNDIGHVARAVGLCGRCRRDPWAVAGSGQGHVPGNGDVVEAAVIVATGDW